MTTANDKTYKAYGAQLETLAAPFDPFTQTGDPADDARYIARPGIDFQRPWLAIRNSVAFQWPLGMQGFSLTIDPTLGIHKFIGDNKVTVDVVHRGEEHLTLSGSFPGLSAPYLIQALRDVVYHEQPLEGKILFVPEILAHAEYVSIVHAEMTRTEDMRGRDASYSIEFVRLGIADTSNNVNQQQPSFAPVGAQGGPTTRSVHVDSVHNTLRKIAAWKLGSADQWRTIYTANINYFVKTKIPMTNIPNWIIPLGTLIYY